MLKTPGSNVLSVPPYFYYKLECHPNKVPQLLLMYDHDTSIISPMKGLNALVNVNDIAKNSYTLSLVLNVVSLIALSDLDMVLSPLRIYLGE